MVLDQVALKSKPIVQVIDAFSRNQKLGLVFEDKVGEGHLIVCAADFSEAALADPMRRQLRSSLVRYLSKKTKHPRPTKSPAPSWTDFYKMFPTTKKPSTANGPRTLNPHRRKSDSARQRPSKMKGRDGSLSDP